MDAQGYRRITEPMESSGRGYRPCRRVSLYDLSIDNLAIQQLL
ncbi:hypothetical protein SCFA_990001 [anaerobic digester metagenome]|uniref:Uncharacterized protein n=1 Tax=anaerobic digester metagenome TaxID=1263854 RepID=A0A485MDC7_9ZZZZ